MRTFCVVMLLLVTGCSSKLDNAIAEYRIVDNNDGSWDELCSSATKVAETALSEQNEHAYNAWKGQASRNCRSADLDRQLGIHSPRERGGNEPIM